MPRLKVCSLNGPIHIALILSGYTVAHVIEGWVYLTQRGIA